MRDFASREDRIRTPVKGLRQRLRVALRKAGVHGKFRTDHGRTFEGRLGQFLIVMSRDPNFKLPFHTFDDMPVVFIAVL